MPIDKADEVLSAYDNAHRAVASHPDAQGLGGALTANAWSLNATAAPLAAAVRSLAATALQRDGRLMLGICANDAEEGVATLKKWVGALQLPRGELHGMDVDGVPIDMSDFGAWHSLARTMRRAPCDAHHASTVPCIVLLTMRYTRGAPCDAPCDAMQARSS